MASITAVRESLQIVLGENYQSYLDCLREWFCQQNCKDDLDLDLIPFLRGEALQLHNQYMLLLLNEGQRRDSLSPKICPSSNTNSTNKIIPKRFVQKKRKPSVASQRNDVEKQRLFDALKRARPPESKDTRFPAGFTRRFIRSYNQSNTNCHPNIVLNITHTPTILSKHLARDPKLTKFFSPRGELNQPYLTCNSTVQGKILLKAWSKGITTVETEAVDLIIKTCHAHIRHILSAVIKRRRALEAEARDSVEGGDAPINPLLTRGSYVEEIDKRPEPEEVGGFIKLLPTDDRDRRAALEAACSIPASFGKFKSKIGTGDLLDVIQADSTLIPGNRTRSLIKEKLQIVPKDHNASQHFSIPSSNGTSEMTDNDDEEDLLPICSY